MPKKKMTTRDALDALGACDPEEYAATYGNDPRKAYKAAIKAGYASWIREHADIPEPRRKMCKACKGNGEVVVGRDQLSYARVMKEVARRRKERGE